MICNQAAFVKLDKYTLNEVQDMMMDSENNILSNYNDDE